MSRTYRHVAYGWGPGNPEFDRRFPRIKTEKHHRKDRKPEGHKCWHCFSIHVKNSRHNLQRKIDDLRFAESKDL
jgi:hypothetical protein